MLNLKIKPLVTILFSWIKDWYLYIVQMHSAAVSNLTASNIWESSNCFAFRNKYAEIISVHY